MIRSGSGNLRNNHHSLHKKCAPFSFHTGSTQRSRKASAAFKENIPNLEQLINDIKISPSSTYSSSISSIFHSLKKLQANASIEDEVRAVNLLMQSIEKKIVSSEVTERTKKVKNIKECILPSTLRISEVSPIKQLGQESSSRILYTNFSIKDLQKQMSRQNSQIVEREGKERMGVKLGKFEQEERNEKMEKLSRQIRDLSSLLEKKGVGGQDCKRISGKR